MEEDLDQYFKDIIAKNLQKVNTEKAVDKKFPPDIQKYSKDNFKPEILRENKHGSENKKKS